MTVSESSKRDILRFVDTEPDKIDVIYNAYDERFGDRAARRGRRPRARALPAARRVRALCRQRQAAQEPRAADRRVPPRAQARPRSPEAGADRRRDLEVRGAAARGAPAPAAQVRALPRLPAGGNAGGDVSAGRRVRLPVALRRVRPAAARSDGQRHAGRHLERLVAARGRRRRGGARRSVRSAGDRRRHLPRADRRAAAPRHCGARGSRAPASFRGRQSVRRVREIYGEVLEPPSRAAAAGGVRT